MPRGGYLQKLAWQNQQEHKDSALASFLLKGWAWGDISAPMVQQVAAAALADGANLAQIQELAKLGACGKCLQNCNAELMKKHAGLPLTSAVSHIPISMKHRHLEMIVEHNIILPHALFAAIFDHHPRVFEKVVLGGSPSNIEKFWHSMQDHPAYAGHPLAARTNHKSCCVPLGVHGDGVSISGVARAWSRSVDAYSWCSLLGNGKTAATNFLIFIMYTQLLLGSSVDNFNQMLQWSFYWLFIGKWPTRDWKGKPYMPGTAEFEKQNRPLAGNFYAVIWCMKADLEHMAKAYKFPWPTASAPCGLCQANSSSRPWTDHKTNAAWRTTTWTNSLWWAAHPHCHPWFTLPGVGVLAFVPDILHVLHLGAYAYFFGSVLKYLTHYVMAESPEANLQTLWARVNNYYVEILLLLLA